MSFRSRIKTTQPVVVRRRSLSNSRVPSSVMNSSSSYLNNSSCLSNRPLSTSYSSNNYGSGGVGNSQYSSRDNLYSSSNGGNSSYLNSRSGRGDTSSYGYSSSYISPYTSSDRYVSPYSTYNNGVVTAGLNLSSYSTGSSYKNSSPYSSNGGSLGTSSSSSYSKKDYPSLRNTNLSSRFSTSNSNLNAYSSSISNSPISSSSTISSRIGRSQSFKDAAERKNAKRTIATLKPSRSFSISSEKSEKSEGYEVRSPNFFAANIF